MHSDEVHDFSFHIITKPLDIFTLTRIAPPLLPLPSGESGRGRGLQVNKLYAFIFLLS
jgi:hypothetical protein